MKDTWEMAAAASRKQNATKAGGRISTKAFFEFVSGQRVVATGMGVKKSLAD